MQIYSQPLVVLCQDKHRHNSHTTSQNNLSHTFNLTCQDGKSSQSCLHHFPVTYFSLANCSFYYFSPKIKPLCSSAGEPWTLVYCGNKHHRTEGAGVGRGRNTAQEKITLLACTSKKLKFKAVKLKKPKPNKKNSKTFQLMLIHCIGLFIKINNMAQALTLCTS